MKHFLCLFFLVTAPILGFADEIFDLSPDYQEGQRFAYTAEFDMKIDTKTISPNEMQMDMLWKIKSDFDIVVAKLADDGSVDLKVKMIKPKLGFSMKGVAPGGINFAVEFDTDQEEPMPHEVYQMFQDAVKSLDQGEFTVVSDSEGRVVDVKGLESLFKNLGEQFTATGNFLEDLPAMTQFFSMATTYLPGHPVKEGETWTSTHEQLPNYQENWKLESASGNTFVLQNKTSLNTETMQGLVLGGHNHIEEGKGNVSETIVLDKSTRTLISVQEDITFSGKQIITEPEEMKSDIKFEYHLKLEKKAV